ncbi:16667_t:CDS:1, partial [Racocetra persica]
MEQKLIHDDCFISLGFEDEEKTILFIILKGDFRVYTKNIFWETSEIAFSRNKVWGYCRIQYPDTISIYDAYCEEEYAKIIIATKEIEILFNERSLSGWLTINKLEPDKYLPFNIGLYLQNLITILEEDGSNDNETKLYINK